MLWVDLFGIHSPASILIQIVICHVAPEHSNGTTVEWILWTGNHHSVVDIGQNDLNRNGQHTGTETQTPTSPSHDHTVPCMPPAGQRLMPIAHAFANHKQQIANNSLVHNARGNSGNLFQHVRIGARSSGYSMEQITLTQVAHIDGENRFGDRPRLVEPRHIAVQHERKPRKTSEQTRRQDMQRATPNTPYTCYVQECIALRRVRPTSQGSILGCTS